MSPRRIRRGNLGEAAAQNEIFCHMPKKDGTRTTTLQGCRLGSQVLRSGCGPSYYTGSSSFPGLPGSHLLIKLQIPQSPPTGLGGVLRRKPWVHGLVILTVLGLGLCPLDLRGATGSLGPIATTQDSASGFLLPRSPSYSCHLPPAQMAVLRRWVP